ncbi:hypothetical protein B0H14DRAFT_2701438 [Mycena olivaceomarginata]|nr:hypothetical protein B0H14DRAFT_2701438 [Mycena olivaceomarginata]
MSVYKSLKQPPDGLAALDLSGNHALQLEAPNDVAVSQVIVRHAPDPVKRDYQNGESNRPLLLPTTKLEETIAPPEELCITNDGVLEGFSRIYEVPCRWEGCTSVLNSFETLVLHVSKIHIQEQIDTVQCQWEACGAELFDQKRLTAHAQTHILETIPCAYQDCNETFRNPKELMEHNVRHKKQGTALKMSWRPTASQQLLPLPELVQDIPAWAVLAPHVWVPHISKERRETLSTWVLRNIC